MRRLIATAVALAIITLMPIPALANGKGAGGVSGPGFFVDGVQYRTVGTPTDLSGTGAPDHSFDIIYAIDGQPNVATAAPGDPGYNGGRWRVHALDFGGNYQAALDDNSVDMNNNDLIDSDEEVYAAINHGYAVDLGVVRSFECPVIPVPRN